MLILSIADDLTGALEVGATFAQRGFRSVVSTQTVVGVQADVVVIDSETRHSTPAAAAERVVRVIRESNITPGLVFKKTDSTLRGNIQSELHAISTLFPNWRIGYAPAYPAQGRTVTNGQLFVNGSLLHETAVAQDVLNPVHTSSVRELVGPDLPCDIFDGETDADLLRAAKSIFATQTMRIVAGPTAIAAVLAKLLQPPSPEASVLPRVATCVVVNGSRTERSESQLIHAKQSGCLAEGGSEPWKCIDLEISTESTPPAVAAARAEHVIGSLTQQPTDAVFLIGGDTAFAFVAALGNPILYSIAEVLPGVAVSRILQSDLQSRLPEYNCDLILITKSGGFGEMDVICRVRQILEQDAG